MWARQKKTQELRIWHELKVSNDSKNILDLLVDRKKKHMSLKQWSHWCAFASVCLTSLLLFYLYETAIIPAQNNTLKILDAIVSEKTHLFLVLAAFSTFSITRFYYKKASKEKKKLDSLRAEVIDRFYTSWTQTDRSDVRDQITQEMKKLGVNILNKE